MVLIKDIAEKCHVSVATVSKALNNHSDIGKATRQKIIKAAEEMGYTANASARALKTKRTYNLGVLFDDPNSPSIAHEYFSTVLDSFKKQAESKGYDITFINHRVADSTMSYLKHSIYRNFDGVAIINADFESEEILELVNSDIPVVTIDRLFKNASAVISDNSSGLHTLTEFALNHGHRKIAYIHGEYTEVTKNRLSGFYSALREYGVEIPREYVIESKYHDIEMCRQKTEMLLRLPDRPTCIIFPDDYSTLGGLRALSTFGLDPDADIGVIGYDGINLSDIFGFTTYRQNTDRLGRLACDKLTDRIENGEAQPEHVIVTGEFVEGRFAVPK